MIWLDTHSRLHTCQAGLRRGRNCVDHICTLSQTIQHRIQEGLPTFLFFCDAAKAFDTVWRDGLFHRLWNTGIRGKMWRIIRDLYNDTQSRVSVLIHSIFLFSRELPKETLCHLLFMPFLRMSFSRSCILAALCKTLRMSACLLSSMLMIL